MKKLLNNTIETWYYIYYNDYQIEELVKSLEGN